MPMTMSCSAMDRRYSRCPAVFGWMTRRSPGRMIFTGSVTAPSRPSSPCASSEIRRSTSWTSMVSPMRARSISACATCPARSIAAAGPARDMLSPRSETRTPKRRASSSRLASFTPANASGSTPSTDSRWTTSSLMRRHHLYMKCGEILGPRRRGRALEQRARRGRLGECDHVAHRGRADDQHHGTVEANREAAVRRGARGERGQQESKAGIDLGRRESQVPENGALYRRIGDTNRTGAQLVPVVDRVVVQRPARERLAVEFADIVRMRRSKWMMREHRLAGFRVGLEQREVDHPAERMRVLGTWRESPNHLATHLVEGG